MTEDELAAIEADVARLTSGDDTVRLDAAQVRLLVAEVRRLAALVKDAEWSADNDDDDSCCPWCLKAQVRGRHHVSCPAFTPDGSVR